MKLCVVVFLAGCLVSAAALRCIPKDGCTKEIVKGMDCPYGHIPDACNECQCAKGPGEVCGGPWEMTGKCSDGLVCDKDPNDFNADGVCVPA